MFTAFVFQEGDEIIKDGKIAFDHAGGLAALRTLSGHVPEVRTKNVQLPGGLDAFPQGRVCLMDITALGGEGGPDAEPRLSASTTVRLLLRLIRRTRRMYRMIRTGSLLSMRRARTFRWCRNPEILQPERPVGKSRGI